MSKKSRGRRDRSLIARPDFSIGSGLPALSDRRVFHPLGLFRPDVTLRTNRVARVIVDARAVGVKRGNAIKRGVPYGVRFAVPDKVVRCVRRKSRKEVLFAGGKAGSGIRNKRGKRNIGSLVKC